MHTQQEPALAGVVQAGEIRHQVDEIGVALVVGAADPRVAVVIAELEHEGSEVFRELAVVDARREQGVAHRRSEEHTSELQSQSNLVCRLLLEKKKKNNKRAIHMLV